jgi:hypothetical protein
MQRRFLHVTLVIVLILAFFGLYLEYILNIFLSDTSSTQYTQEPALNVKDKVKFNHRKREIENYVNSLSWWKGQDQLFEKDAFKLGKANTMNRQQYTGTKA